MNDTLLTMLYSGSTGNAALLADGDCAVLIDAGRSAKALFAALGAAGTAPEAIRAVFLTHEHRDHISALEIFLQRHPVPVHIPAACAARLLPTAGEAVRRNLVIHPPLFRETVGPFCFSSFCTPHDSAGSVGYRIEVSDARGTRRVGYATDLGTVTDSVAQALLGCEEVVLECNHDEEMLMTGPYPFPLKRRIASRNGHLSNAECARFCARLAESGTRKILLAHLSEKNNLPSLAAAEVSAALAGTDVLVRVADPVGITPL